jgi:hypothetical protein
MRKLNASWICLRKSKRQCDADANASYKKASHHPVTLSVLHKSTVPSFVDAFRQ